ncbi:penicillin-binding protein 1A [Asaia krungthepensis]|uniref:Penicillin-binding protein 1A n=1 Tax=Asaia krungthepensis NRIC 0535 TaxID=1307925 RepID=A0ABQ0Q3N6_9PROT|nr:PBP1A family penicillin-binding protein [Asaia krungthepensis]GBQ89855.1 penicillin-binding protein 1A [Asaia krungthepensis NRIC 0535]
MIHASTALSSPEFPLFWFSVASGGGNNGRTPLGGHRGPEGGRQPPRGPRYRRWRQGLAIAAGIVLVGVAGSGLFVWHQYERIAFDLPSVDTLKTYQPPTVSRIYTGDDRIMAELAAERRIYVPINAIPERVKNAFIAPEDQNFYTHAGLDPLAIIRAELTNLTHRSKRALGASTITQQVARNMLLNSNARTLERKEKEALLALRIEQTLSKDKILEIYLNGIYLGNGAYGVAAAAQTYFNKPLDQLTDAEAAFLGALPKSPANYNPYRHPERAIERRNWVLDRMAEIHAISHEAAEAGQKEPLIPHDAVRFGPLPNAEWFGSEVRRQLIDRYGPDRAMQGGLEVHTSLDRKLQDAATLSLRQGLMEYDRAHSRWRGPVAKLHDAIMGESWVTGLKDVTAPAGMIDQWRLAVVLNPAQGRVGWISQGSAQEGQVLPKDLGWLRSAGGLAAGDVIMIEPQADSGRVAVRQVPKVEGALVSLDARTGRVLAMVGGWSFKESQFNRATQALRQPGSSFKPFVYLDAMEQGIPPSEKFDDAPVSYGDWHPKNYEEDNWGPTTLHDALRESRNLVTIRLAAHLGMKSVADMAISIGLVDQMPHVLPAALGAVETTVLREAGAYATIASGGKLVTPSLIDAVLDRDGSVLWKPEGLTLGTTLQAPNETAVIAPAIPPTATPPAATPGIAAAVPPAAQPTVPVPGSIEVPQLQDKRRQVASAASTYQITAMMQDVIKRGTGTIAGQGITREIAGKTGTSQDFRDAWFAGFTPDIVTVVWVGFDTPQSLGKSETGGRIAGPIWNRFMKVALEGRPELRFRVPEGVTLARYDTGRLMAVDGFKADQVPGMSIALHGFGAGTEALTAADTGTDLYDTETDMAGASSQAGLGEPGTETSGAPKKQQTPNAQPQGDIGMGGLY